MLKISRLTDYAVVILSALGATVGDTSATGLAMQTGLPAATVAKLLKQLGRAGLVASARGATGGYRLAKPLDAIDLVMVVEAIDGPLRMTQCVTAHNDTDETGNQPCAAAGHCALHGRWNPVNEAIANALAGISLAQLCQTQLPQDPIRHNTFQETAR